MPKAKGWATPHGLVDFAEKVTFEHACKVAKNIHEKYASKFHVKNAEGGQTQGIESIGKSGVQTLTAHPSYQSILTAGG